MREMQYILALFLLEVLIYFAEITFAAINKKNKKLLHARTLEDVDFIDLSEGYRTSISFFRISIFISYLILVFIYLDISKENTFEKYGMIGIVGILIYIVSLFHVKTFIFYDDYFIVTAPFNFFHKDIIINYGSVKDFKLYDAFYYSYFLILEMQDHRKHRIFFSGSVNPRNDLTVQIIVHSKKPGNDLSPRGA